MTRYSKIFTSLTNIGIPIFTYYTLPETQNSINQCENLWEISLISSFITLLLLCDSLPKTCNEKNIIWTSYCCIPIPYTIIVYILTIFYSIFQFCKIISLNNFCQNYYKENYNNLWLLNILQVSNYGINYVSLFL